MPSDSGCGPPGAHPSPTPSASSTLSRPVAAALCAWNRGGAPGTVSPPGRLLPPAESQEAAQSPGLAAGVSRSRSGAGARTGWTLEPAGPRWTRAPLRNPHFQESGPRAGPDIPAAHLSLGRPAHATCWATQPFSRARPRLSGGAISGQKPEQSAERSPKPLSAARLRDGKRACTEQVK